MLSMIVMLALIFPTWGLGVTAPNTNVLGDENGIITLSEYFDLLTSGNEESARYLWTPEALERSSRFGIEYSGIPLKVDCVSPIVRNIPLMRNYLQPPVKTVTVVDSGVIQLHYSHVVEGNIVEHDYFLYSDGDYYWLTYPQDYYAVDWPIETTRFFRIHVDPSARRQMNPVVLAEADQWVADMLEVFDLDSETRLAVEEKKIEYFYCGNDEIVQKLTGHRIKGTYDLASDDILSAFFPHYHELVHLFVNLKLRQLPMYAQPILREGIAVYYGGRWSKSPETLMNLAGFLYKEKIVDLDSLLTMGDFDANSSADIAYPVAGLFVAFLIDKMGQEELLKLYSELSGDFRAVYGTTRMQVKDLVMSHTGHTEWTSLLTEFDEYIDTEVTADAPALPGSLTGAEAVIAAEGYSVTADQDWVSFVFTRPAGTDVTGNLLFARDARLVGGGSELFWKQYQDRRQYEGYRFGVRFDQNEVGLYDYATDHLIAKYIWGITPSDDYFLADQNSVNLRIRRNLIQLDHLNSDGTILIDN